MFTRSLGNEFEQPTNDALMRRQIILTVKLLIKAYNLLQLEENASGEL